MNSELDSNSGSRIEILEVSNITLYNKALWESGKAIFIDSIEVGREFCKSMVSLSLGAVPIYLGILKIFLPDNSVLTAQQSIVVLCPPILFLIACIMFAIGYIPQTSSFSLDIPDEIEKERTRAIRRRSKLIWTGFSTFLIGILAGVVSIISYSWII